VQVQCNHDSGDAALIQAVLDSKNAAVVSGNCLLGGTELSMAAGAFLGGSATLSYTGSGFAVGSNANGGTITGLTFDGGGIELPAGNQNGWTIVFNTIQNVTSGRDGVYIETLKGAATTISHNAFKNIWQGGYPNLPSGMTPAQCGQDCLAGNGIFFHNGIDNTTIDDNRLDEIGYDGIKGFWDGFMGNTNPYLGHNVVISNNVITHYHRIGIEVQAAGQGNCPGGCNYNIVPTDGTVAKNNFVYLPALTNNVFAFSLMIGGTNAQIINNTGNNDVGTCYVRAGIGLENSMQGGVLQGNVIGSIPQSCYQNGWADFLASGYTQAGKTDYFQNNLFCGPGSHAQGSVMSGQDPYDNATLVETADAWIDACPEGTDISSSNITIAFTSPSGQSFPSGGQGTFDVSVVSNLSIKQVDFFVDGAGAKVASQEVQDVNQDFATDHAWHYHATFDTTALSSGSHTLTAYATDVSNAVQSASQSFTR